MKKNPLPLSAWLAIAIVILLAVGICLWSVFHESSDASRPDTTSTTSSDTAASTDKRVICKSGEFKGMSVYPSGSYKVGEDIPAGTYLVLMDLTKIEAENVNVSIFSASDYSIASMIADFSFPSRGYLVLQEGQYCSITNGVAAPVEDTQAYTSDDGTYPENCYQVGRDLPKGSFILSGEDGSYALYRGGILQSQLQASGQVNGKVYLELQEGDYLEFTGATGYDPAVCTVPETDGESTRGMLLVGTDLPAGSYTVTAVDDYAYLVIQQGPQGSDGALDYERISLPQAGEQEEVVLEEGEYLILAQVQLES